MRTSSRAGVKLHHRLELRVADHHAFVRPVVPFQVVPLYAVLPFPGAGAGPRQGEMFGLAVDDIDFLRRVIHVRRQVRLLGTAQCFAEVKNRKPHDVPLSDSLAPLLAEHIRQFPPIAVTLPWQVPDGDQAMFPLLVTRPDDTAASAWLSQGVSVAAVALRHGSGVRPRPPTPAITSQMRP